MITSRTSPVDRIGRVLLVAALAGSTACRSTQLADSDARVVANASDALGASVRKTDSAAARREVAERLEALLAAPLDADAAVQIALLNNQRIQAEFAELGVAQADLLQAGLFRNPTFSGGMIFAPGSSRILDFSITQDFLDILLAPLRVRVAEAELAAMEQRVITEIVKLAMDVRSALIEYQAATQTVELWETVLEAQEAAAELAARMGVAGNVAPPTITNERILLEQVRIDATGARLNQQAARERLNQLLGLWGRHVDWRVGTRMPDVPQESPAFGDVEQRVVEQSRSLAAGRAQLEAAARRVGLQQLVQALPMIQIGGAVEAEKERGPELARRRRLGRTELELTDAPEPTEWWGGPNLTIPIPLFDFGQAARARGVAEVRRIWDLLTAESIELRAAARLAAYRVAVAQQQARYYSDVLLPLRVKLTDEVLLQYNAMSSSPFDVLNAKIGEIEAGRRLIRATADYWNARIAVDALFLGVEVGGAASGPGRSTMMGMGAEH